MTSSADGSYLGPGNDGRSRRCRTSREDFAAVIGDAVRHVIDGAATRGE